jgi:hypothetical protein
MDVMIVDRRTIKVPLLERVRAKVIEDGDCWEWQGCMGNNRIPQISYRNQTMTVRRALLIDSGHAIKGTSQVRSSCGNQQCVNPAHAVVVDTRAFMRQHGRAMTDTAKNVLRCARIAAAQRDNSNLSFNDVTAIRASTESYRTLGERYGVCKDYIGKIKRGEVWKDFSAASNPFAAMIGALTCQPH